MRITDRHQIGLLKDNLTAANRRVQGLTAQVSSGQRVARPSDDPAATGRILRGQAQLREVGNRQTVIQTATRTLGIADNALGEMASALRRADDIAIQGQQGLSQPDERTVLAGELRDIAERLYDLGNSQDGTSYVFGGKANTSPPLVENPPSGDPVGYAGDHEAVELPAAPGTMAVVGVTGQELFNFADPGTGQRAVTGVAKDVFQVLYDLAGQLEAGDTAGVTESAQQLQQLQGHVVQERGRVGLQEVRFQAADRAATDAGLRVQSALSADQDVDIVQAVLDLRNTQTAYEGALTAISEVMQLPTLWATL
jgi:flagellar hook-associated protein 3 FlgL